MKSYWILESFLGVRKPSALLDFHYIAKGERNIFCCINSGGISCVYDIGLQEWETTSALTFKLRTNQHDQRGKTQSTANNIQDTFSSKFIYIVYLRKVLLWFHCNS